MDDGIEAQEVRDNIYSNDMMDPNSSQLIRWQEDLDPLLINLYYDLKSYVFDPKLNKFVPIKLQVPGEEGQITEVNMPPILDDIHIHELISLLKPLVHHNTMLGTHNSNKVGQLSVELADEVAFYLSRLISDRYLTIAQASMIDSSISTLLFNTYTRGTDNKERDYIKGSSKTINMYRNESGDRLQQQ